MPGSSPTAHEPGNPHAEHADEGQEEHQTHPDSGAPPHAGGRGEADTDEDGGGEGEEVQRIERPASFGPAWSQAPSEEGSRCRARSSVTPSCHRATTPHSARWRAMGSIPTADALNSAANGAFLPRSQAMTARAMAIPSTTSGVTHTPLAMAVTSLSRPAVVICSVSSASGIPLSCPDISSFWRMPGAGSQRRAKAAPAKDVAAMRASSGQRMRRSWTALATPVPGSVSVRGRVSAVIGKCPALRRLGDVIAPGFRQWRTPSGTPSASGL